MRVGIITQPLHGNYGGILQNYALQYILKTMGHHVTTLEVAKHKVKDKALRHYIDLIKENINKLRGIYKIKPSEEDYIYALSKEFITTHIDQSYVDDFSQLDGFDCYIVGSDQVWRPYYSDVRHCFLDWCKDRDVKRIAYAASFGTDNWEFDERLSSECQDLIKRFEAVSVRESSGVKLCEQYLQTSAMHVLDPTLLAPADIYERVLPNKKPERLVIAYLLDQSPSKIEKVKEIAAHRGCDYAILKPYREFLTSGPKHIEECRFLDPADWLWHIKHGDYIITDSFHGTVFSIIFHKEFVAISNSVRGDSRFLSLLSQFDLTKKFVTDPSSVTCDMISQPVNWDIVEDKLQLLRRKSMGFLVTALR